MSRRSRCSASYRAPLRQELITVDWHSRVTMRDEEGGVREGPVGERMWCGLNNRPFTIAKWNGERMVYQGILTTHL